MLNILNEYDIVLSESLHSHHGICGHTFELLDYYQYFTSNKIKCCILTADAEKTISILKKRYTFSTIDLIGYLENQKLFKGNRFLFVDGKISNGPFVVYGKRYAFKCLNDKHSNYEAVFQDSRIYEDLPNSIHYVKKINFDYYKEIKKSKHRTLLYLTSNCRMISEQEILRIRKKYPGMRFLIISDVDKPYFHFDNSEFRYVPVDNLFEEFDTYMYTEVKEACHGDCSPRFIAECKFYGKEVIYENLTSSPGLEIRKYDIEHNFEKLFLTKNDPLVDYIFR